MVGVDNLQSGISLEINFWVERILYLAHMQFALAKKIKGGPS